MPRGKILHLRGRASETILHRATIIDARSSGTRERSAHVRVSAKVHLKYYKPAMVKVNGEDLLLDIGERLRSLSLRSRSLEITTHYPWSLERITEKRLKKDATAPGGTTKLREACWRRGIDVSSRSWSKTCIAQLLAWKEEFKKTGLPREPDAYAEEEAENEATVVNAEPTRETAMYVKYAPWDLKGFSKGKLTSIGKTYGVQALRGMCLKRRITVSGAPTATKCIKSLVEWKKKKCYSNYKPPSEQIEDMPINDWDKLSPTEKSNFVKDVGEAQTNALEAWIWLNLKPKGDSKDFRKHMKAMWGENFVDGMDTDHIIPRKNGGADHPKNYQLLQSKINVLKYDNDPLLFATLNGVDVTVQVIEASMMMSSNSSFKIPGAFESVRSYAESLVHEGHTRLMERIFEPNGVYVGEKVKVPLIDVARPLIKVPTCGQILTAWENISRASVENDKEWTKRGQISEEDFLRDYSILKHQNYDSRYFQVVHVVPLEIGGANHADNYVPIAKHVSYGREKSVIFVQERKFMIRTGDVGKHGGTCPLIAALIGAKRTAEALDCSIDLNGSLAVPAETAWFIKKSQRPGNIASTICDQGKSAISVFFKP